MKITHLALSAALILAPAALFAQSNLPGNRQTIGQRKVEQQDRIAGGVRSGQLTARETGHLERQEAAIDREERSMRAQDNGHLTRGDRRLLTHQQNQESRRIRRDKHNARMR